MSDRMTLSLRNEFVEGGLKGGKLLTLFLLLVLSRFASFIQLTHQRESHFRWLGLLETSFHSPQGSK